MKKNIIPIVFLFSIISVIGQESFAGLENNFYQVISGVLKAYNPITGGYSEGLHTYSSYNAGGYNNLDNFLYAIRGKDKHLLRIGTDKVVDLGAVLPSGTTVFGGGYAADVDAQGNLWVYQNNTKNAFHKIINLEDYDGSTSPVFEVVQTDISSPSTCADIVFIDGNIYGGSRGKLYIWDLSAETPRFSSKNVANLPKSTFGAAYTDANKQLYLSDNNGGLYVVNDYKSDNPTATLLNLTETTNSNDGFKCATSASPLDKDKDGILDALDADCDGDGISNEMEHNGLNPLGDDDKDDLFNYLDNDTSGNGDNVVQDLYDRDKDGIPDFLDIDADNDGIYDIVEIGQGSYDNNNDGVFNNLDPNFQDTDNDGIANAFDADQTGTVITLIDTDADGIYDCYDIDSDNDGIVDIIEGQLATTYIPLSKIDNDQDGLDDAFDPNYNGTTNGTINTDNTDMNDHLDTDANNDGILDTIEAYDSDGDGVAETIASGFDADQDGLDDNFDQRKTNFDPENGGQTPDSFPIPEICNRYNYLGDFSSDGTPLYLAERDSVSQETLNKIDDALPESYPVPDFNPHYISSGYESDILLQEEADIWVTFLGEGAGYKNTLGFYTYDINNPTATIPRPEDITIIFPNVSAKNSGGGLSIGDKVNIGRFSANTGIGWVLLANAWSEGCVSTGNWQLYSNPEYNPESDPNLRYHNVLLADSNNEKIILGFEDIRRDYASCDQDFNDTLFYITASPYTAIKTDNYVSIDSATDVTSANDGGLESNGDLASLIAKRNFNRTTSRMVYNTKQSQKKFQPNTTRYKSATGENLSIYFPETGIQGTENSYVSSPEDLLKITNANAVFSVDYYDNEQRIAAALATTTVGNVYDHTKTICDRLNGSKLLDVRTVLIKNKTIISTKIQRATGEIEYALTFSIRKTDFENEIYSLWNIADYPEGDYTNFQVWGGSVSQVAHIANHIIEQFVEAKSLRSHKVTNRVPNIFVQHGTYHKGKLILGIINKKAAKQIKFIGNIRQTEQSPELQNTMNIQLSGSYQEEITIDTGFLFDIGFSIVSENDFQSDVLYLADGPWGIDYIQNKVIIADYRITKQNKAVTENAYTIERNAFAKGEVKETMNLFRNILPGELNLEVSSYNSIQFEMKASKDVEVIIVTKDLQNWDHRLRYHIAANDVAQVYTISLSDFSDGMKSKNQITDIKSIVFSIQGDYEIFQPFEIGISNLNFISKNVLNIEEHQPSLAANKVIAYPNPCSTNMTIQIPNKIRNEVHIQVIDLLGRTLCSKKLELISNNKVIFRPEHITSGIYQYIIKDDQGNKYIGSFMKK